MRELAQDSWTLIEEIGPTFMVLSQSVFEVLTPQATSQLEAPLFASKDTKYKQTGLELF